MPPSDKAILYIAGYGRSGSTLLDMVLSLDPNATGLGELTNLFYDAQQQRLSVPAWEQYTSSFSDRELAGADLVTKQLQLFPFFKKDAAHTRYRSLWEAVINEAYRQNDAPLLVDSSKTTTLSLFRPYLLRRSGHRVHLVHLVRDARAVMYSEGTKGDNVALEYGGKVRKTGGEWRVLLSWTWTNIVTRLLYGRHADYTILRYEDLVASPNISIQELYIRMGLTPGAPFPNLSQPVSIQATGISGNRLRRTKELRIRPDVKWRTGLPAFFKKLAIIARPVMYWFGYRKPPQKPHL